MTEKQESHPEEQYLSLVSRILIDGQSRDDRTGVGTLSMFGPRLKFSLRDGVFPLLTTKKIFWRGLAEELLWFISGDTNSKTLEAKGINIWKKNGTREYLDKLGLTDREVGDLGPIYSFQWRHFGAKYTNMHADYTGQGVDQLAELIKTIKTNPTDRRMILSAWNPADLKLMALPPCHAMSQFYVCDGELSCHLYQRSGDMGLGVPFNIASYSLLTIMMAHVCGLKPGDFIHSFGDAHIYKNHFNGLIEQLGRKPRPFPTLRIKRQVPDIDSFTFADFELVGYDPHPAIEMEMAV